MEVKDLVKQDLFFKENFSVDECLSKYTHKADLETLRIELKSYGTELQQQMSEILKTETEAIVNLAEHLTNLQVKIEHLQQPVCQLREEILSLHNLTDNAKSSYENILKNIKHNNTTQNNVQLKQGILSSSSCVENSLRALKEPQPDMLTLEHIINKFSFQKYYMEVLNIITPDIEEIVRMIKNKMIDILNANFIPSFEKKNVDMLTRCLRLYNNLVSGNIAYETFRISIVKPYLEKVLTEKNLEKFNQDLDKIYEEVLIFIDNEMDIIDRIINENPDFKSYNFMLYSFWKEFDRQSRLGLPYITAPGNPELFKKRFSSTFLTLQKIAEKCGDANLVREDETFQEHLKRFNLPVYYEIQYQKIAGRFENDFIMGKDKIYVPQNHLYFKLKPTLALYIGISKCFEDEVYIDQLADQFLKLSLMLLSRYLKWFTSHLQDSPFTNNAEIETFIMDALYDLSLVTKFLAPNLESHQDVNNTLFHIVNENMKPVIAKIFKVNQTCIVDSQIQLKNHLVQMKLQESIAQLQNVGAIPRLYRKTNRSAPKEASQYVVEAVKPVLEFHKKFVELEPNETRDILKQIILKMTNQYHILVQDVLKSVCKTENSLRRLKNRNIAGTEESASNLDTMSDEMKIREQIKFDVNYFYDKLHPLASTDIVGTMDLLKTEI